MNRHFKPVRQADVHFREFALNREKMEEEDCKKQSQKPQHLALLLLEGIAIGLGVILVILLALSLYAILM